MGIVRIGFFEDFKSEDILLLEGDQEGLHQLSEVIRSLISGKVDSVEIDKIPFVEVHKNIRLLFQTTQEEQRIIHGNYSFRWDCTPEEWEDVADKITALMENNTGHQYFETPQDDVIIMVSLGEYGPTWWEKHG